MRYLALPLLLLLLTCSKQEPQSFWTKTNAKDEFGEPIEGRFFYTATIEGTLNSAPCNVEIMKTNDFIGLGFSAPGTKTLYPIPDSEFPLARIREEGLEERTVELFTSGGLVLDTEGELIKIIESSHFPIKVLIDMGRVDRRYQDKYLFTIDKNVFLPIPN